MLEILKADQGHFHIAAAFVSGLATYFMGLPDLGSTITTVAELREELVLHHSYARGGGPVAIWNGAP